MVSDSQNVLGFWIVRRISLNLILGCLVFISKLLWFLFFQLISAFSPFTSDRLTAVIHLKWVQACVSVPVRPQEADLRKILLHLVSLSFSLPPLTPTLTLQAGVWMSMHVCIMCMCVHICMHVYSSVLGVLVCMWMHVSVICMCVWCVVCVILPTVDLSLIELQFLFLYKSDV